MLGSRATSAALAAVFTAVVALPAAAATGATNGGASPTAPPAEQQDQSADSNKAATARYQRVKATWYGPGFWGNRTACGMRLTRNIQGVAHKRLPCGTKVALRYRGRTIVVPVIDRGPFAHGAVYDLTQATARSLHVDHTTRLHAAPLN
jgi:rare lipoprotein A (peptidoglycan hydrolase)